MAITLQNFSRFSAGKRMKFAAKLFKNFRRTLSMLQHYLVECKRSKTTENMHGLQ